MYNCCMVNHNTFEISSVVLRYWSVQHILEFESHSSHKKKKFAISLPSFGSIHTRGFFYDSEKSMYLFYILINKENDYSN